MVDKDIMNEILMNKMKKIALISGITGQDGSFLAEFLIEKDMKSMVFFVVLLLLTPHASSIFIWMNGYVT